MEQVVRIPIETVTLEGTLDVPEQARGIVVFAHGSGSSRLSPRNAAVAAHLRSSGAFGTLLFDLLTAEEDLVYRTRFDIGLLTRRLVGATNWLTMQEVAAGLQVGLFGASTGAAAALRAAVELPSVVRAVVSRGGRPDLAEDALHHVQVPTLLIVGGRDDVVIGLNRMALERIPAPQKRLEIVPGASHLFEEPGAIERVAELTLTWFEQHLAPAST